METLIMMSQETPYQILNPWRQNTPADDDAMKEKILKLGICLLRGSEKATAKELMSRITLAMSKLKHGTNTEDILNVDAKIIVNSSGSSGNGYTAMDTTDDEGPLKLVIWKIFLHLRQIVWV
ncbi:unnamed protein product [Vicia faba]|uniref:Uncharacterized protein n=1 Tax=Vicia faba TaxID=3906 RepID=A0AAV1A1X8_VICFA|nr:unnamed protein product [Vicia faba]